MDLMVNTFLSRAENELVIAEKLKKQRIYKCYNNHNNKMFSSDPSGLLDGSFHNLSPQYRTGHMSSMLGFLFILILFWSITNEKRRI